MEPCESNNSFACCPQVSEHLPICFKHLPAKADLNVVKELWKPNQGRQQDGQSIIVGNLIEHSNPTITLNHSSILSLCGSGWIGDDVINGFLGLIEHKFSCVLHPFSVLDTLIFTGLHKAESLKVDDEQKPIEMVETACDKEETIAPEEKPDIEGLVGPVYSDPYTFDFVKTTAQIAKISRARSLQIYMPVFIINHWVLVEIDMSDGENDVYLYYYDTKVNYMDARDKVMLDTMDFVTDLLDSESKKYLGFGSERLI